MTTPVRLPSRKVLRLAGADVDQFLNGLLTRDGPTNAAPVFAALLTPQGKILFDFHIQRAPATDDAYWLDVAADHAEALVKRLTMYRLRAQVTIERADDLAVIVSEAPFDGAHPDPRLAALGARAILPAAQAPDVSREEAYDARRRALGVPEFGAEFNPDAVFLLDVNYDVLAAVSYSKGCFVGQEVTSRMKRKGEVRRRTLIARYDGPAPARGAAIRAGETSLGEILSAEGGVGLAMIRIDRLRASREAGAAPSVDGVPIVLEQPAYLIDDDGDRL